MKRKAVIVIVGVIAVITAVFAANQIILQAPMNQVWRAIHETPVL